QSAVVSITTSFDCRDSLLALARSATLGGVLKLHSQLDANPNNLVLCGKFPADSPEGIQCFTLPNATVLVRIEVGTGPQYAGKARVAVRSSEPVVALAVRDDLLLAFAELPVDAEPSDPNFDCGAAQGRRLLASSCDAKQLSKAVSDKFARQHTYLRLSLTDKCNMRCQYCMPPSLYGDDYDEIKPPSANYLTADEIVTLASEFVNDLGISKIRLTGGEPTVRSDFSRIVEGIAGSCGQRLGQFGITTNGVVLERHLPVMRAAGLLHVNVSLDTLIAAKFPMISNRPEAYWRRTRKLIDSLRSDPDFRLKVNCVVMRGVNDDELLDFVELTREENLNVRFIEYMPFSGNNWGSGKLMLSKLEILNQIRDAVGADNLAVVEQIDPHSTVGREYRVKGYKSTFGVISSMTDQFCSGCNRIRVSADGLLYNCLFASADSGVSLRDAIREGRPLRPLLEESLGRKFWALGGRADMYELGERAHELRNMMKIGG
ncbi:Molybdenum cofactor synthesis protein 1, partial [Perkinsus olseni]